MRLIKFLIGDRIYHWLLHRGPRRIFWVHKHIDTQHKMWFPRYGASKRMMREAEDWAERFSKSIKWE